MTISVYEDAIKRFLRKISPKRDWQYISEVEHVWMTELYDELVAEFKAENAKLCELVRDMYACISHANEQDWFYFERDKFGCGMSCTVNGENCGLSVLTDRMRELGIEVDR